MTIKLKRSTFKYLEGELYYFKDTLKEIERLREEIMTTSHTMDENIGAGRNSVRNNTSPTEMVATRLLTNKQLKNLEEMANAISEIYENLPETNKSVIKNKYWSGKKYTWDDISIHCHMHKNTAYKIRREFINLLAIKLGLR